MRNYPTTRTIFDDMINSVFNTPNFGFTSNSMMKTDIRFKDGSYILDIEIPGYKKEDLKISLFNGELTVSAEHNETQEEKDARGNIVRQERYSGSCSRTYYVGDIVKDTDIRASYHEGILSLEVPSEIKKEQEEKKYITIG